MKNFAFFIAVLLLPIYLLSQNLHQITQNNASVSLINSSASQLEILVSVPDFQLNTVKTQRGFFNMLQLDGSVFQGVAGNPSLPMLSKIIQIPENAQVSIDISQSEFTDYNLSDLAGNSYKLMPFQPSVSKSNVGDVPFYYNESVYQQNTFISSQRANVEIEGNMRNIRIAKLLISPFDYNPATGILRHYTILRLQITFPGADYVRTEQLQRNYGGFLFSSVENKVLNSGSFNQNRDVLTQYPVKFVIVADTMFHDALQPFVEWKTKKGFIVVEAYTSNPSVGNTTTSIKSYLQGLYNVASSSNPAPSFILIVGDIAQVPAFNGTTATHVTDMYYAEYTGDMIADAYFGRFSATNVNQLQPQIDKTLEYEQYLFPTETWLDTVVMIAGADATYGPLHGNGQINYGTTYYFNNAQGLFSYTHLYPASASDDLIIRQEIGRGVSYANYTAHGYDDGWGDPSFDKTDIPAMNNAHKYPLMVGNACLTNSFQQSECFGEALLRADLKGALGYIGGSNSTYWNEDYYWGVGFRSSVTVNPTYDANHLGSYDCVWHISGEPFSDWFVSQGQMVLAGNLAVLEGSSSFDYYSEIYHLMGDPSLMVYMGVPTQLTVNHPALIPLGQNTISVTTEPYTYVGISQNGLWHGAGIADASGNLTIDIIPFSTPGLADIVGTKQNRKPFISTFNVLSPSGPYVLYNLKSINDVAGNSNQQADITETIGLNVNLKNYGLQNDTTVYAILSSTDPYIEVIDSTGIWGLIQSGDTVTINNAFTVKIDSLVPDQYVASLNLMVRDSSGNSWTSSIALQINAPVLTIQTLTIDDVVGGNGNGKLDPGETVNLGISVVNSGHAEIRDAGAILSSMSPYITINSSSWQHDSLFVNIAEIGTYSIEIDPLTPVGTAADFTLDLQAWMYSSSKTFTKSIGQVDEDWESGTLAQFAWASTGAAPWIITSGNPYEGAFAAMSGDISDDQESILSISINVLSDDTLSFYKKVSCEVPSGSTLWDYLDFKIDGTSLGQWGGEIAWSKEAFYLTAGVHTLSWVYHKDYSLSTGTDAAWVDYIVFPPMLVVTSVDDYLTQNSMTLYPNPATGSEFTILAPVSEGEATLNIVAADGKVVYRQIYRVADGIISLPVGINNWEAGVYTVELIANSNYFCSSLVIIN